MRYERQVGLRVKGTRLGGTITSPEQPLCASATSRAIRIKRA